MAIFRRPCSQPTRPRAAKLVFTFTITNAGSYIIQVLVNNAPTGANNSFYVNVDAQPTDRVMIWDIPITSGFFVQHGIGGGTARMGYRFIRARRLQPLDGNALTIIRGRESNVQLQSLAILYYLAPPQNLQISSPLGLVAYSARL